MFYYKSNADRVVSAAERLCEALERRVLVLDGGLGTGFDCSGLNPIQQKLWSSAFLHSDKSSVVEAHRGFVDAGGCDIIETNTYQTHADLFIEAWDDIETDSQAVAIFAEAVRLAERATEARPNCLVVGSIGPYGACLADGSEYSGGYLDEIPRNALREWHEARLIRLSDAGVSLFALETMPSFKEVEVILDVLQKLPGVKCWITFQCANETETAKGEKIREVILKLSQTLAWKSGKIAAVGVNCVEPKLVTAILKEMKAAKVENELPFVVYPNSGEKWDAKNKKWIQRNEDQDILSEIGDWIRLGARIIGGCCRVQPQTIKRIKHKVASEMLHFDSFAAATKSADEEFSKVKSKLKKSKKEVEDAEKVSDFGQIYALPGETTKNEAQKHLLAILEHKNIPVASLEDAQIMDTND